MGLTKTERFTAEQNRMAEMAKAVGHPARIAILQFLARQDNCFCGSIVEEVGLAQATVSQHLKALKEAGLITGTIAGVSTCYCIDQKGISELRGMFNGLLDNCCTPSCC